MTFRILFDSSIAKHLDTPEDNEDAYRIRPDKGRIVLSDGASESFDAKGWANLLVDQFIELELSEERISLCIQSYEKLHDPQVLSWSRAAAYERGSFATLIIAQDNLDRKTVTVTSLGDSFAMWCCGKSKIETLPYTSADQFAEKPFLLGTRKELNAKVAVGDQRPWTQKEWSYDQQEECILLCMTDALGAWLLNCQEQGNSNSYKRLFAINDYQSFLQFVKTEQSSGRMRKDDTTLIIASLSN